MQGMKAIGLHDSIYEIVLKIYLVGLMVALTFTLIYVNMTRKCLNCETEFEAKRDSAKYCSDNCRVKWNYKKGGNKKKLNFQVAENKLLDLIEKLESKIAYSPITPAAYDAPPMKVDYDEPKQWQEPKKEKSEMDFLNDISKCDFEEEYKTVYEEIRKSNLSDRVKERLYQNMKMSKMNK